METPIHCEVHMNKKTYCPKENFAYHVQTNMSVEGVLFVILSHTMRDKNKNKNKVEYQEGPKVSEE